MSRWTITVDGKNYEIEQYSDFVKYPAFKYEFANFRIFGQRGAVGSFQVFRYPNGEIKKSSLSGMEHLPALHGEKLLDALRTSGVGK